ncbi:unnamed protein product [Alternaria alternata]
MTRNTPIGANHAIPNASTQTILPLPEHVVAQIKSSTAIVSLTGVVLELLKNSLDAKATKVEAAIDFARGGCSVEDDGLGISPLEFREEGGLGKLYCTSKYHATEPLLGRNGTFLASLAAMSLLTISSHHYQHRSHNAITFHQSKAVERQLPASAQHEISGRHGTRVTVRNLFGNLPVRVKQRSIIAEQRAEHDRLWDGLKKDVTSLLLSWQSPVSIRIRDSENRVVVNLSISGSGAPAQTKERETLKTRSAQLSSLLNVLTQANYIAIDQWPSWVPASAATSAISIKGAISLDPAPSKHVQFISLGIRPLCANDGHNELFDAVNRLFALSSFGTVEDDTNIDELEKRRRQSDKRFKHDGYTNRQLKARKDVDRYPMFYLRISLKDARRRSVPEEQFLGDEASLQSVMEVLDAMITQWLSVHHFRPRQPRKKRGRLDTASSAAESLAVSNSSSTEGRTTSMASSGQSIRSRSATPKPVSTSSQSLKRKRPDKTASRELCERSRPGVFAEWSRIKSGKPEFFSSVSTVSKSKSESDLGKEVSMSTSAGTNTEAFAKFDIPPLSQGALSGQHLPVEASTPTGSLGIENKENDDTILWTDPNTKKVYLLNARTGCAVPDARPRPTTDSSSSTFLNTQTSTNKSVRLPTRASTAVPGKTPWLDNVLDTWDNPVFKPSEKRIQQAVLHEDESRGHRYSRHGCSRIDIDKAFNQASAGGSSRLSREGLQNAQVIAQVDKKFILVKMKDSTQVQDARSGLLVLIDQHAADERVQVESLLSQLCNPLQDEKGYQTKLGNRAQVASVVLEKPTQFAISSKERIHFATHAARFAAWGILYDILGTTTSSAVPDTVDREKHVLSVTGLPTGISERCKADPKVLISFLRSTVWKYAEDPHLAPLPAPLTSSPSNPTDWISFDEKGDRGEDGRVNIEDVDQPNDTSGQASSPFEKDDKETRRIIRKIDLRLLPTLAVIYAFALIDRVNLPNARIAGMDEDLGLSIGSRYSILTMIFFIPYIIFQFPGFSNILAWGLSEMRGLGGLNGWQWIFAIEGAITVLLGFMGFVTIIDFPDKASQPSPITKRPFLTSAEANIILARIQRDRGDAVADKLTWSTISTHLRDWKIWEFAWLYFLNNVVAYSWGYFLPIILRNDMKHSVAMSQILSFPPYVLAAAWMFATAWVADRYRMRGAIIIFNCAWAVLGVCMMAFLSNARARYAGVFLGVSGANANVPSLLSYMHNNIVGQMKRSVASALLIGGGACGGIAASNIFRQQDAPKYTPAMAVVIATQVLTIVHVLKNFWVYSRANRQADRGERILEGQEGFRQTL